VALAEARARDAQSFALFASCTSTPGRGVAARMRRRTCVAGCARSMRPKSRASLGACVTRARSWGVQCARPASICSTAATSASPASAASRDASSPAVSSGAIAISRTRHTSPASISFTTRMTEMPVRSSPASSACSIGAAPRQRGKRLACALIIPWRGSSRTLFGMNCPNATTTPSSGSRARIHASAASSATCSGCSTSSPSSSAALLTGVASSFCPRPRGRSGCETTPTSRWPLAARARRPGTANSGVPK